MSRLSLQRRLIAVAALSCSLIPTAVFAQQHTIVGSGSAAGVNSGFGNVIGSASTFGIAQSAPGAQGLTLTLNRGTGGFNDVAVMYIATGNTTGTGFTTTSGFNDLADGLRRGISGTGDTGRATINFAPGFTADFAIAFAPNQGFGGLWSLANGGNNSLGFIQSVNFTPSSDFNAAAYTMNLNLSALGLTPGGSFDYVVTYLNPFDNGGANAFRSDEFNGVAASTVTGGNIGVNPVTLNTNDFNRFVSQPAVAVPEPGTLALVGGVAALGIAPLLRRRRQG